MYPKGRPDCSVISLWNGMAMIYAQKIARFVSASGRAQEAEQAATAS
jgi:hypothetical protein